VLAGLSFVTVQTVEKRGIASSASLDKIAKALDASPDRLLDRGWDLASVVERDYSESAKRRGEGEGRAQPFRDRSNRTSLVRSDAYTRLPGKGESIMGSHPCKPGCTCDRHKNPGPFALMTPEQAAAARAAMSERKRQAWASGAYANRLNGSLQPAVQKQISESVKRAWAEGDYANRIDGIKGRFGAKHHNWTGGVNLYREIYEQHWPLECLHCGNAADRTNVHHVDENKANYLLSNLACLCVPCHLWRYHYVPPALQLADRAVGRQPVVAITKTFPFEYSHILPWHPGKCGQLHGHSGHLIVELSARLDPNGVVEDYYDVGRITKMTLIDRLDHRFLNDWIPNPTSEEFLVFAWIELELAGLKGLSALSFSETESTTARLTKESMLEAFWWDIDETGKASFVQRPRESEETP